MQTDSLEAVSPTIGNTVLPAVFVKTRYDAEEQMKLGNTFKATSYVTPYNREMLDFYMSKYNYKKSKLERGVDLYEPVS